MDGLSACDSSLSASVRYTLFNITANPGVVSLRLANQSNTFSRSYKFDDSAAMFTLVQIRN